MKIDIDAARLVRVLDDLCAAGDAEQLGAEYAADLFDVSTPASLEIEIAKDGPVVLAAYELLFSAELDGWYTGNRIEDESRVLAILKEACGL